MLSSVAWCSLQRYVFAVHTLRCDAALKKLEPASRQLVALRKCGFCCIVLCWVSGMGRRAEVVSVSTASANVCASRAPLKGCGMSSRKRSCSIVCVRVCVGCSSCPTAHRRYVTCRHPHHANHGRHATGSAVRARTDHASDSRSGSRVAEFRGV